jgi:deoxyadenosine/deoxycytidine kinase
MRIAISGNIGTGKSTLIEAFKKRWPMYSSSTETYRDILKNNPSHSSKTTEETQLLILDWMMREQDKYPKGTKHIFDRCTWDNLVYTLYANSIYEQDSNGKTISGVSDEVCAATISLVRESLKNIDIVFWLKRNPSIIIPKDNRRDTDKNFLTATDKIYSDLFDQYMENLEYDIFLPKDDCPAFICIDNSFSTVDDRLMFIGEFIDYKGDLIEGDSLLDPDNLEFLENMLKDQERETENEARINKIVSEFKK